MSTQKARVYIVDENPGVRKVACEILQRAGIDAVPCAGIQEAADLAGGGPCNGLAVVSSELAARNGPALAKFIGRNPQIRILLSCARRSPCPLGTGDDCLGFGCLAKPDDFLVQTLVPRIRAALSGGVSPKSTRVRTAHA